MDGPDGPVAGLVEQLSSLPSGAEETAAGLMRTLLRFEVAHGERNLVVMRACFHDEAVIESVASGGLPLGPDETVEAIRVALTDHVYSVGNWAYEQLRPDVILSITGARHLRPGSGMTDATVYRLISGRDGLMWRARLFGDREQALAYLERHGPSLRL